MKASNLGEEIYVKDFFEEYRWLMDSPSLRERLGSFIDSMSHGLDDLISDLLTELRSVTAADGASIYVVDGNILRFIYVQNDTLEESGKLTDDTGENLYLGRTIAINENSMCGYVAKTKKPLIVGNVQAHTGAIPFTYNEEYDRSTGYSTKSALTAPILDDIGSLVGILQLINHKDERGSVAPFEDWMLGYVLLLVEHFFPMIARTFDRYRSILDSPWSRGSGKYLHNLKDMSQAQDLYFSIRNQLKMPALNKRLPWLKDSGVSWTKRDRNKESNISKRLLSFSHYVNQFEDISSIIEMMLTEARDATRADGGTFYLVTGGGDTLSFAYVQNDTLFSDNSQRNHYINMEMPISRSSISGYAALEKKILNIPDVGNLPDEVPYSFNKSFDEASGYTTVSVLTVPILGSGSVVIAVLQLVNCKDADGRVKSFSDEDVRYADLLSGQTMPYLTRSIMTRRLIDSMLRISNLRDPEETGAHVHRVGSFAAEIYHRWAVDKELEQEKIMIEKDTLRIAAMLHDIGKVSVPDSVLHKPGKLTAEERLIMETHCAKGAALYSTADSKLERMAYDITLHHHQRWDGNGYTGDPNFPPRAGLDIPLFARITSAADVLDALAFPRVYKPAWSFEDAMAELVKNAGTQFDPDVIAAAEKASDTLKAVLEKYR
ncbi:MAG: GAF domain-containing protein [Synergistaceae bacterium]|jgi:HD-GYP domain-containing protein (c-di-GMP phosphodiesterase class II)|nr:GAF domain-containing protein [Synergistaceae bacterium]